jgi:hypothetical protein
VSRAYRVAVRESQNRTIRAEDHVSTTLEILGVLPPEDMAGLLADELARRGFERQGDEMVRQQGPDISVRVNVQTGTVTVRAEAQEQTRIEAQRESRAFDDDGPSSSAVRDELRKQAQQDIDRKAGEKQAALQTKVTDRLEGELNALRQELDEVVNRVTAEALKRKASQMGQIKEMTEDPQAGSLTIVVEV